MVKGWANSERRQIDSWDVLEYMCSVSSFSLCTPSGGTIRVASALFDSWDASQASFFRPHPAICLSSLTIETSELETSYKRAVKATKKMNREMGSDPSVRQSHSLYQKFQDTFKEVTISGRILKKFRNLDGCSPQISRNACPGSLDEVLSKKSERPTQPPTSDANIIQEIIALGTMDEPLKRDEIKRIVAPNMKIDAWRVLWGQARDRCPKLGKPGPKPRKI